MSANGFDALKVFLPAPITLGSVYHPLGICRPEYSGGTSGKDGLS
jgi:hypothetical protein